MERASPSSGGLECQQLRFKREHRPRLSEPCARIPTVLSLFGIKLYLLSQGHFGREGEGTFVENKIGPKAQNTKYLAANAMHKAKYGRTLNEKGTA